MLPYLSVRRSTFAAVAACLLFVGRTAMCAAQFDSTAASGTSSTGISSAPSNNRFYSEAWSTLLEDASALATILAIGAAGAWAYFNFIKGRVYRPRLELDTSAVINGNRGSECLLVTSRLKNVGLSKVAIVHEGTVTRVCVNELTDASDIHEVDWKHLATFGAFTDHEWIEPGELIRDQRLFVIPTHDYVAFQVETRVASHRSEWNATHIVSGAEQATGSNARFEDEGG